MQVLGILIELRGEGAANAGIYRHTWRLQLLSRIPGSTLPSAIATGWGIYQYQSTSTTRIV